MNEEKRHPGNRRTLLESQPDTARSAELRFGSSGDAAKRADSEIGAPFLGQLKTLLTGPELPVASDVAVPWDIAYFIEFLKPKLGTHPAEFLTALVTALNERTKVSDLDRFSEWRDQPHVPLDASWPD